MDNQNNNKGGLVNISKNILEGTIGPDEEVKKMTDASGQMNEDVVVHPNNFENVQSQSMVESARETAKLKLIMTRLFGRKKPRKIGIRQSALLSILSLVFLAPSLSLF